jgi:hypothetical protein
MEKYEIDACQTNSSHGNQGPKCLPSSMEPLGIGSQDRKFQGCIKPTTFKLVSPSTLSTHHQQRKLPHTLGSEDHHKGQRTKAEHSLGGRFERSAQRCPNGI